MQFRLKVRHVFKVAANTILITDPENTLPNIAGVPCVIEINGQECDELTLDVDTSSGMFRRNFWTRSSINLTARTLAEQDVWLVSRPDRTNHR